MSKAYRNKEVLEKLWYDDGLTYEEISERFGISKRSVYYWMDKHSVNPGRDSRMEKAHDARCVNHVTHGYDGSGYEYAQSRYNNDTESIRIHRLVAIAHEGIDRVVGNHVHHKNGIPWDNRPTNLEVLSSHEHRREHQLERDDGWLRSPGEDNPIVECECGCGETFRKYDEWNRPRKYVSGHNMNNE